MPDHPRIWLQADAGNAADRLWCEDKVWPDEADNPDEGEPTEYVRADICAALVEALETVRSGLRNLPASATAVKLDEIAAAAIAAHRGQT